MALAFVATAPRIPQFYAGTEIQMTSSTKGRDDASYRRDFPGGWRDDKVNAFTGTGLTAQQQAAQDYVKKLFNWRKTRRDPPREADALRPGAEYLCLLPLRWQPQGDGGAE
jgi:hypothetical protein